MRGRVILSLAAVGLLGLGVVAAVAAPTDVTPTSVQCDDLYSKTKNTTNEMAWEKCRFDRLEALIAGGSVPPTTPPPTTTSPPATTSSVPPPLLDGRSINAANTGIAGAGLAESTLTVKGQTTYGPESDGMTVSGVKFTGQVRITANNFTLRNCVVDYHTTDSNGIDIVGANVRVENCTVRSPAGTSLYNGIVLRSSATNAVVKRNDISKAENYVQVSDSNGAQVVENYMHDASTVSNTAGHADGLELFGLTNLTVARNRISSVGQPDGVINCSPFGAGPGANGLYIVDNFLDGGQETILVDNQSTNAAVVQNVQVLRNYMGGHTIGTPYRTFLDSDGRGTVATLAAQTATPQKVLWPVSGADANYWAESGDLTPDRSGQVAVPQW